MRIATFLAPRLQPLYEAVARGAGADLVEDATFEDLSTGAVDAAFICGLPYVRLRAHGVNLEPLAAPVVSGERYGGRPVYFSDVIVRSDDPARSLDDLADRTFALNEDASWSGYGAPLKGFADAGLDPPSRTILTGSHAASIAAVRSGEAAAAAIDSHLLDLLRADDPSLADVRTLLALGPWPIQPLVAAPGLGEAERERLRTAVFELNPPEGTRVERFVAVGEAEYESIARAL
jgi:phosphonate transport system substrate-binding protein